MAYVPDYTTGDVSASVLNFIAGFFVGLGAFISIIVLVVLARWLMGKKIGLN